MNNETNTTLQMGNKTYDRLKPIVEMILPGIATLWLAIASIWGLPFAEPIAATIVAINAFLGICLAISNKQYKQNTPDISGDLLVDAREDGADLMTVALEKPLENLSDGDEVRFKVIRN